MKRTAVLSCIGIVTTIIIEYIVKMQILWLLWAQIKPIDLQNANFQYNRHIGFPIVLLLKNSFFNPLFCISFFPNFFSKNNQKTLSLHLLCSYLKLYKYHILCTLYKIKLIPSYYISGFIVIQTKPIIHKRLSFKSILHQDTKM